MPSVRLRPDRPNLTEYQRHVIRFAHTNGHTVEEIRALSELKRSDGSPPLKRTIVNWIKRLNETGDTIRKKPEGRKRKLNLEDEAKLIRFIDRYPLVDYATVREKFSYLGCSTRSINRYATRNGFSKLFSFYFEHN